MAMDWVEQGEQYLGQHTWGSHGKQMGISRMWREADTFVGRGKWVQTQRPRGILSGFLAIVPSLGYGVYVPPMAAKHGPLRLRLRVSEELRHDGAIFSAYLKDGTLVLEDVLVWKGDPVWHEKAFHERWKLMAQFLEKEYTPDAALQGTPLTVATYAPLSAMKRPDSTSVLEFVPNGPKQKRVLWVEERTQGTIPRPTGPIGNVGPVETGRTASKVLLLPKTGAKPLVAPITSVPATVPTTPTVPVELSLPPVAPNPSSGPTNSGGFVAKREAILGPDVFSVWRGGEKVGLALVRTLAISKALRLVKQDEIRIRATWNKQFDKWEILDLA